VTAELIVIDDGSADGTGEVVRGLETVVPLRLLRNRVNRGKGYSVRRGVWAAEGRYVGFIDADNKTAVEELAAVLPHLEAGRPLVIGSRVSPGARIERGQGCRFGSRVFSAVLHQVAGLRSVPDPQCGFKFFDAEVARRIFSRQFVDGPSSTSSFSSSRNACAIPLPRSVSVGEMTQTAGSTR
jgi:dolichyl-phosphate beta-glucosyltransferase